MATDFDKADVVEFLVSHGANMEAKNDDGFTALLMASTVGRLHLVKILVSHGANMEARTEAAYTPLMCATDRDKADVVEFLLSQGADPTAENKWGSTPMDRAKSQEVRDMLQKATMEKATTKCKEDTGGCNLFVMKLVGRVFENQDSLIKSGHDARQRISKVEGETTEAANIRRELLATIEKLLTMRGATAAETMIIRDVSFDWRARVMCDAERKKQNLEKTYEDFLCVELPKLKQKAVEYLTAPLVEALHNNSKHVLDYDADKNHQLSMQEFKKWEGTVEKELSAGSRRLGGQTQSRRLFGDVNSFCSAASDAGAEYSKTWQVVGTSNYGTASGPFGLLLSAPHAVVAIAAAVFAGAMSACAAGFVVRRRSVEELNQGEEIMLE